MIFWGGRVSVLVAGGVVHEVRKSMGPSRLLWEIKKEILSQVLGALLFSWAFEKECSSFQSGWSIGSLQTYAALQTALIARIDDINSHH